MRCGSGPCLHGSQSTSLKVASGKRQLLHRTTGNFLRIATAKPSGLNDLTSDDIANGVITHRPKHGPVLAGCCGSPKETAPFPAPFLVRTIREQTGPLGYLCGGEVCSRSNNHKNTPHQPRFLDLPQRSAEPLAAGWSYRFEEFSSGRGLPVAQLKGMQHEAQISRCGCGFCVGCGPSFGRACVKRRSKHLLCNQGAGKSLQ
jgi:hypothetical protein